MDIESRGLEYKNVQATILPKYYEKLHNLTAKATFYYANTGATHRSKQ